MESQPILRLKCVIIQYTRIRIQAAEMTEEVRKQIKEVEIPVREIFKDMIKYAPSKLFGLLGNIIIVPVYTNLLTPSQYGTYAVALAVLSFLCIIFSDWIGLSGLRFFRQHQISDKIQDYLSTLLFILGSNLCVMYVLAFLFRKHFYTYFSVSPKIFLFILVLIIPVAIRALLFQVLRAQIKPGAFTISTIINQILTIAFSVLIIKIFKLGALSILIGMALSISIIDILLVFQSDILKYLKFEIPKFNMLKSLFLYGLPIAIAALSLWFINQSNKFITSHFYGLKEAGLVGVAYNMTFPVLMTLFAIITIAAYPRIINLYEDKIDVRPVISRMSGYYFLIAIPLILVMSAYAPDIISIFANAKYQNASVLVPYLAFSVLFMSLTDYTTMQYHLSKKTYILTTLKVWAGIAGLVLNIILIKKLGLAGVGIATLISNIFYFVMTVAITVPGFEWRIPCRRLVHILVCLIPSILVWLIIRGTTLHAGIQMSVLLFLYYLIFWFTNKYTKRYVE